MTLWCLKYTEFRKILEHCKNGLGDKEIAAKTGVSTQTINNWKKLLFATGSVEKKKAIKHSKPYKYAPEKIGALLDKSKKSEATLTSNDVKIPAIPKVKVSTKEDAGKAKKDKSKLKAQLKL